MSEAENLTSEKGLLNITYSIIRPSMESRNRIQLTTSTLGFSQRTCPFEGTGRIAALLSKPAHAYRILNAGKDASRFVAGAEKPRYHKEKATSPFRPSKVRRTMIPSGFTREITHQHPVDFPTALYWLPRCVPNGFGVYHNLSDQIGLPLSVCTCSTCDNRQALGIGGGSLGSVTRHCHILETGNDSFRFKASSAKPKSRKEKAAS